MNIRDFVKNTINRCLTTFKTTFIDSKSEKVVVTQESFPAAGSSAPEEDPICIIPPNTIVEATFVDYMAFDIAEFIATEKCEYCIKFNVGSTVPTLSLPSEIIWAEELILEADTHYVILISYENGRYYGDWKSYPLT